MKITHAMILAAGLGTRMRPLTETLPKPLISVMGKPLIDWCLDWLEEAGVAQVVVNSSYRAEQLEAHLVTRVTPQIHVSHETMPPLETGGGVAKALPWLGSTPFLTMNSDAIFLPQAVHPISMMEQAWDDEVDFVMLMVPRVQAIGWEGNGDFVLDAHGRVRRPAAGEEAPYIFTGVEIMHPRVFTDYPAGPFSLSFFWKRLQGEGGWFSCIRAVVHEGPWLNVGDLAGLAAAETYGAASMGKRT